MVYYAVPWIESEAGWGSKPEGFMLYRDLQTAINDTKTARAASGGEYYYGPMEPLTVYECKPNLSSEQLKLLESKSRINVDQIHFVGPKHPIK